MERIGAFRPIRGTVMDKEITSLIFSHIDEYRQGADAYGGEDSLFKVYETLVVHRSPQRIVATLLFLGSGSEQVIPNEFEQNGFVYIEKVVIRTMFEIQRIRIPEITEGIHIFLIDDSVRHYALVLRESHPHIRIM